MAGQRNVDSKFVLKEVSYGIDLLKNLNDMRIKRLFTDTILCLGQEEFPCHKNILSASSPYFHAMFTNDVRENRDIRIYFDDISPWTFKRILDYVYTGRLEISTDNAQEMLAAGCRFQYPAIVDGCCKFLQSELHPSNCLGIYYFAHMHSCKELEDNSWKYALENFSMLVQYDEFLEVSLEQLMRFVSSDLIEVRNEETVYNAVIRWIKFDVEERKQYMMQLMQEVRLPVININNLKSMENEPLVQSCEGCIGLVLEAEVKHETIHDRYGRRRRSMQDTQVHPRPSTIAKEVIVVVGGLNGFVTRTVEMFDPQKDTWMSLPDFPKPVTWFSVSAVVNCIIVAGGITDGRIVNSVWKFDTLGREWHEISHLTHPRAKHSSAVLHDRLYVFGGVTFTANFDVVDQGCIECFDPATNTWSVVGHSSFPRTLSKIVPFGNLLVEVGGQQGEAKVNTMECYEGSQDNISIKTLSEHFILPEAIQHAQIVVLNGVFYIIWEDTKKVITLDPEKRTFQRLPDLHYSHKSSGATVLKDKIYVLGGMTDNPRGGGADSHACTIVECYDPETKTWSLEKPMQESRGFHGCVTVNM
ncbi:kelch-like protein 21 [Mya arenaria]|uniref:kelch-like protein 21 n=1 Tax=Mya arenaria TaxID=6604 RepID=UPI0022E0616A|nr:kelch-like protein 21 [Mya arenaria]